MTSGIDGCGLFAQQMPEVFVLSEHGLTIGLVMEQTLQFVGNILRRKTTRDKFLDDLLIRNNIYQSEMRNTKHNWAKQLLQILAPRYVVHRCLWAADECCLQSRRTRIDYRRLSLCHYIIGIAREQFARL